MIDKEKISLTEADTASYDATAQILKAAMAYVNPSIGKAMGIMAKSIELQHLIQYMDRSGVSACDIKNRSVPPEEVIRDLRKYCGTREREQLDRCLNLMNMIKMYEVYKNFSGSTDHTGGEADYLKKMQAMLTPEQIELIHHLQNQQNT